MFERDEGRGHKKGFIWSEQLNTSFHVAGHFDLYAIL